MEDIKKARKEGNIKERDENIFPLFRKVDINFTKKNTEFKEYLVLYLNDNFNKEIVEYDYIPIFSLLNCIEKKEVQKYIKYAKVNNDSRAIISLEAKNDIKIEGNPIKIYLKFKIPQNYNEKRLITLEIGYNIKFIYDNYGFLDIEIYYENDELKKGTLSLSVDDSYKLCDDCISDGIKIWKIKYMHLIKNNFTYF